MRQIALDILCLVGLAVFLLGVHQVYPPAALMLGGLGLSSVAVLATRRGA